MEHAHRAAGQAPSPQGWLAGALAVGMAVCGAGSLAVLQKVMQSCLGACRDGSDVLWGQSWPQLSQLPRSIRSFGPGLLCWEDASSSGAAGSNWCLPRRRERAVHGREGKQDPAERRARAHDVRRGERLCLEQLSMESPKAVALEAPSHLHLRGAVAWEKRVTNKLCLQSLLSLSRAFPLGGSSGWRPPPTGMGTPTCWHTSISQFARSSALGGGRGTISSSSVTAPGCSPSWAPAMLLGGPGSPQARPWGSG